MVGNFGAGGHKAWSTQLADKAELKISRVIVRNGYTATDLLECLEREVLVLAPKKVVFICGSNDAYTLRRAEAILSVVKLMARAMASQGALPVWLIPPDVVPEAVASAWGDPIAYSQRANATLRELRQLAINIEEFRAVDLEAIRQGYLAERGDAYCDGLHFNGGFHDYLARQLEELGIFTP